VVIAFVDDHRDRFGVAPICRVLTEHGVPIAPNSYYAHKTRAPSARAVRDEQVLGEIERVYADPLIGRGLYGVRKVHAALARAGGVDDRPVSRRQVERLMRAAGLQGACRGRRFVTTRRDQSAARPPDLVKREFSAVAPNRLWVVDFTYVPTWSGMAFTAFVSDVFSRRIVGWRTATSMPTSLPLDALEMALWTRRRAGHTDEHGRLEGLIQHSDAGAQYTAIRYAERLTDAGVIASIGTVGDSYDNALAESLIGLYKLECVRRDGPFRTVDDLELATLNWVHWFNEHRLHSSLALVPPVEFETEHYRQINSQQQPLSGGVYLANGVSGGFHQ
jgi:putative transposase